MSNLNVGKVFVSSGLTLASYATSSLPGSANVGDTVFDTTENTVKVYNGSTWASGSSGYEAQILVVAGGGGGGHQVGGAGGAGGVIYDPSFFISSGTKFGVYVGDGGLGALGTNYAGYNGEDSWFGDFHVCRGGGSGGNHNVNGNGTNYGRGAGGGSGGGGGGTNNGSIWYDRGEGGFGIPGQGYPGGLGWGDNTPGFSGNGWAGGGGGGAGGNGADASNNPNGGGQGGAGLSVTIGGITATYGGGGGGCGESPQGTLNNGGSGGGGRGAGNSGTITDRDGTNGLGGGGGGVRDPGNRAGDGGSGRIIIAYAGSQRGSGGTISTSGGFTRHTFNYTGSLQTYTG